MPPLGERAGGSFVRGLVRPAPAPWRWGAATRVGAAALVAIGVPVLAGRTDLGLVASTGVLSGLYWSDASIGVRVRRLPLTQLAFVLACLVAAVTAATAPALVPAVLTAVDLVAGAVFVALKAGPPAALFFVMAPGITAGQVENGLSPLLVLTVDTAAVLVAGVAALAPLLTRQARRNAAAPVPRLRLVFDAETRAVLSRLLPAIMLTAVVAAVTGVGRPYWAEQAVVSVLQLSPHRRTSATRAVQRGVVTVAGAAVAVGIAALHPAGVGLAVLLAGLLFGTEVAIARLYPLALLFLTPLSLTIAATGDRAPVADSIVRVVDTALGSAIALVVLGVEARPRVRRWSPLRSSGRKRPERGRE